MDEIINFLKQKFPKGIQTFYCKSIIPDSYAVIFKNDKIEIRYCESCQYVEILGLSLEEKVIIKKILGNKFI